MNNHSYISSFFDDYENAAFKIWEKVNSMPVKRSISDIRILESILFKRSTKKVNFFKSRYYVLFEGKIVYFKVLIINFIIHNSFKISRKMVI